MWTAKAPFSIQRHLLGVQLWLHEIGVSGMLHSTHAKALFTCSLGMLQAPPWIKKTVLACREGFVNETAETEHHYILACG